MPSISVARSSSDAVARSAPTTASVSAKQNELPGHPELGGDIFFDCGRGTVTKVPNSTGRADLTIARRSAKGGLLRIIDPPKRLPDDWALMMRGLSILASPVSGVGRR
jgi:hypothetical protein